jgi:hypothetical protein
MFLTQGATYHGMPQQFAYPAAFGDLVAAVLALITAILLDRNLHAGRTLLWIFNIWGSLDLLQAITLATYYDAQRFMGAAYWIPAFWVPALLVSHYIIFLLLARNWAR